MLKKFLKLLDFIILSYKEIKNICWPNKKETFRVFLLIILIIIVSSVFIWIIDNIFIFFIKTLIE